VADRRASPQFILAAPAARGLWENGQNRTPSKLIFAISFCWCLKASASQTVAGTLLGRKIGLRRRLKTFGVTFALSIAQEILSHSGKLYFTAN